MERCHFCGGKAEGYARAEDKSPHGPYFNSCYTCARKPYPVPPQFMKLKSKEHIKKDGGN